MTENEMGERILANLEAILSDNGSEMSVSALDRSLYKYTDCGAHLSVQLHDGTWRHSGNLLGTQTWTYGGAAAPGVEVFRNTPPPSFAVPNPLANTMSGLPGRSLRCSR